MDQLPKMDMEPYITRLNAAVPTPQFMATLKTLSGEIAEVIEREPQFQRGKAGQVIKGAFENEMWAMSLLTAAWTSWIFQSKSICHYGVRWSADMESLEDAIVPSLNYAIDQGRKKAITEKIIEKLLPQQAWDYASLRKYLLDNNGKRC
jgi:hypothetical protein